MRDYFQNARKRGKYCRFDYKNKRVRAILKREMRKESTNGQLFVDIRDGKILYCFRDMHKNTIMGAAQYMEWDRPKWNSRHKHDHNPAYDDCYLSGGAIKTCEENITEIGKLARLMTREQLDDFLNGDYEEKPFN